MTTTTFLASINPHVPFVASDAWFLAAAVLVVVGLAVGTIAGLGSKGGSHGD